MEQVELEGICVFYINRKGVSSSPTQTTLIASKEMRMRGTLDRSHQSHSKTFVDSLI